MTAKEICALAFDEAGITFAEDAKGGNKSFYKNQAKNGGFDGSQKNGGGDKPEKGDEPFDLQKHDQQHHGGHYDGGKCKYREDAVKNGLITPEQAAQAREIIKTVGEEKAANLPEQMVQNIAKGRLQKFFKENTLEEQEYTMSDDKKTCKAVLAEADKEAKVVAFKRFSLND